MSIAAFGGGVIFSSDIPLECKWPSLPFFVVLKYVENDSNTK